MNSILRFIYIFIVLYIVYVFFSYIMSTKICTKTDKTKIKKKSLKNKNIYKNNKNVRYQVRSHVYPTYSIKLNDQGNVCNQSGYPSDKEVIVENSDIEYYKQLERERQEQIENILYKSQVFNEQDKRNVNERVNEIRLLQQQPRQGMGEFHTLNILNLEEDDNLNFILQQLTPDNQNVHDSTVQYAIKNKFLNKDTTSVPLNEHNLINEIVAFAQKNGKDYQVVRKVLQLIYERNANISNLDNATEMSILFTMWSGGSDNVKLQLINELLDMQIDSDHIVCPTGVASRLVNAEIVENPERSPKTIEMIREEMMNTASHMRTKLEKEGKNISSKAFKQVLYDQFREDYNNQQDIISLDTIKNELDKWNLDNDELLF